MAKKKLKAKTAEPTFKAPTAMMGGMGMVGMGMGLGVGMGMGGSLSKNSAPAASSALDFSADSGSTFQQSNPDLLCTKPEKEVKPVQFRDASDLGVVKHRLSGVTPMPTLADVKSLDSRQVGNSDNIEPASEEEYQRLWANKQDGQSVHTSQKHLINPPARRRKDRYGYEDKVDEKIYQEDENGETKIIYIIKHKPKADRKHSPYLNHDGFKDLKPFNRGGRDHFSIDDPRDRRGERSGDRFGRDERSRDYQSSSRRERSPERRRRRSRDRDW